MQVHLENTYVVKLAGVIENLTTNCSRVYELKIFCSGYHRMTITWITPDENGRVIAIIKLLFGFNAFEAKIYEVNIPIGRFSNTDTPSSTESISDLRTLFNSIRTNLSLRRDCELAKALGISPSYLSRLKRGTNTLCTETALKMIKTTNLEQMHPELAEKLLAMSVDKK